MAAFHRFLSASTRLRVVYSPRLMSSVPSVAQPLLMPALSPTMTHGNVGAWNKRVGDVMMPGDVICEIETDKATVDFENQDESILARVLVPDGAKDIPVGGFLGLTVEDASDLDAVKNWIPDIESASTPVASPHPSSQASKTSVATEGLKRKPLIQFRYGKRSSVSDTTVKQVQSSIEMVTPSSTPRSTVVTGSVAEEPTKSLPRGAFTDLPLSNIKSITASRLTQSKRDVPHHYATMNCNMGALMQLRSSLKSVGVSFSVNDAVIKAAALALRDNPSVNSSFNPKTGAVTSNNAVDISVAVATEKGLITPIVTNAPARGLSDINSAVRELAGRARAGKLKPEEFMGGSFTISNLGMFGIDRFTAVINPPQSCILAVGRGRSRLVPTGEGNAVKSVTEMSVSLSADRRVVDSASAGHFLMSFQKFIENHSLMSA